jgi:hypothetical protein
MFLFCSLAKGKGKRKPPGRIDFDRFRSRKNGVPAVSVSFCESMVRAGVIKF